MTTETKARKGRKPANKKAFRNETDPKLLNWPTDFDSSVHTPLTPDDFADECQYVYWDNRAEYFKGRMEDAQREASLCRKFGSKEQRAKVSQLEKLRASMEALKAELGDLANLV
jgi:hypothetical protein